MSSSCTDIVVTLDGKLLYTHHNERMPARARRFFDEMDLDMQKGISLKSDQTIKPDQFQRLQYVAIQLFNEIQNNNLNQAKLFAAYINDRDKSIGEIRIQSNDKDLNLILVNR